MENLEDKSKNKGFLVNQGEILLRSAGMGVVIGTFIYLTGVIGGPFAELWSGGQCTVGREFVFGDGFNDHLRFMQYACLYPGLAVSSVRLVVEEARYLFGKKDT